ncbi:MAG: C45 family autoproteolytic acyltransferase/hydrolase [Synechococcus sp.]
MGLWPIVWNVLRSPSASAPKRTYLAATNNNVISGDTDLTIEGHPRVDSLSSDRWKLPVLFLKGTDYEIGLQHGRILKTEIQALTRNFFDAFAQGAGKLFYDYIAPSRLYHLFKAVPQHYQAELHGMADGAELPLSSILLINFFDDILNLLELGWAYSCSTVAAKGAGARTLMGRNLDYNGDVGNLVRNYQAIVVRQPHNAPATASVTVAGQVGILTGMNQHGLSLGSMTSQSTEQDWNGLGCSILYRLMLDRTSNVSEAITLFQDSTPAQGNNLMLADANAGARLEFTSARHRITHLAQQPLGMSNHFLDPELAATHSELYHRITAPGSQSRYSRLCEWSTNVSTSDMDNIDIANITAAMTDRQINPDYPLGDREAWQTAGVVNNQGTLHSVIFDPKHHTMHVAVGLGDAAIETSDFVAFQPFESFSRQAVA